MAINQQLGLTTHENGKLDRQWHLPDSESPQMKASSWMKQNKSVKTNQSQSIMMMTVTVMVVSHRRLSFSPETGQTRFRSRNRDDDEIAETF